MASGLFDRFSATEAGVKMQSVGIALLRRSVWIGALLLVPSAQIFAQNGGGAGRQPSGPATLPAGDAKEIVAKACNQCHGLAMIMTLRDGRVGWQEMVDNMILRGAQVRPEEANLTIDYLFENFGPSKAPMQSPKGTVLTLADGAGKTVIESHCMFCHDVGRITGVTRSKNEWEETVKRMMHRGNISVTPDEVQTMTAYLTAQYGKKAE